MLIFVNVNSMSFYVSIYIYFFFIIFVYIFIFCLPNKLYIIIIIIINTPLILPMLHSNRQIHLSRMYFLSERLSTMLCSIQIFNHGLSLSLRSTLSRSLLTSTSKRPIPRTSEDGCTTL